MSYCNLLTLLPTDCICVDVAKGKEAPTAHQHAQHRVGICIATCCHHACVFADYVGKEWYIQQGFTAAEFEVLKKWSGWATSVANNSHNEGADASHQAHNSDTARAPLTTQVPPGATTSVIRPANISTCDMQQLGWKTKRIFDQGRVNYINSQFCMLGKQVKYCDRILSPECVLIVASEM